MTGSRISVWDTAGSERLSQFLPIYFRKCDLLIMCYRINDERSIEWLKTQWYQHALPAGVKRCLLVATQADCDGNDDVEVRRITLRVPRDRLGIDEEYNANGFTSFITSSKTGEGVADLIEKMYAIFEEKPKLTASSTSLHYIEEEDLDLHSRQQQKWPCGNCVVS